MLLMEKNSQSQYCVKTVVLQYKIRSNKVDLVQVCQYSIFYFHRPTPCQRGICRVYVCLSVTSRCSTETAKRRITQTTPYTIAQLFQSFNAENFLTPKILAKLKRGHHPKRKRQMQVGQIKIGAFQQITRYNPKTIEDRHIVDQEVACALSNGNIADDLE